MRNNAVPFDADKPINSLCMIIKSGIEHSKDKGENQINAQNERSLGLISAMMRIIKYSHNFEYGNTTTLGVKWAIPKIIIGNKGKEGTESKLEKKAHSAEDQADSYFLLAYSDFGILGGIYTLLLYFFVFFIYHIYSQFLFNKLHLKIAPIFILFSLSSIIWNVEGKFESAISWFFGSIFVFTFIFICEKGKQIALKFQIDYFGCTVITK